VLWSFPAAVCQDCLAKLAREAIRNLLRDIAVMAMDADAATSRGFIKGKFSAGARRPPWADED
jgi:hypothetical protein